MFTNTHCVLRISGLRTNITHIMPNLHGLILTKINLNIAYSTDKKLLEENYTIFLSSWRHDELCYAILYASYAIYAYVKSYQIRQLILQRKRYQKRTIPFLHQVGERMKQVTHVNCILYASYAMYAYVTSYQMPFEFESKIYAIGDPNCPNGV